MRTLYYLLIGVLLFYIDTAIGLVIPLHFGKIDIIFVPHLTLMYILIMTVYRGFGVSIVLAIFRDSYRFIFLKYIRFICLVTLY